jgi:hypothetical protein
MGCNNKTSQNASSSQTSTSSSTTVSQALDIARHSEEGARDPVISNILKTALNQIWSKVQAKPDSYVMTQDEFAVFNYFQHYFVEQELAIAARRRYWDSKGSGSSGKME